MKKGSFTGNQIFYLMDFPILAIIVNLAKTIWKFNFK